MRYGIPYTIVSTVVCLAFSFKTNTTTIITSGRFFAVFLDSRPFADPQSLCKSGVKLASPDSLKSLFLPPVCFIIIFFFFLWLRRHQVLLSVTELRRSSGCRWMLGQLF